MNTASLSSEAPALIPIWTKYAITGCCLAFLIPRFFAEKPSNEYVPTSAVITGYVTSSTKLGSVFSPTLSFTDQQDQTQTKTLENYSSQKPFSIGESLPIYYLPAQPDRIFLEQDPYQEAMQSLTRLLSIPFFLLSAIFLLASLLKVKADWIQLMRLATRLITPWLFALVLFAGLILMPGHLPSQLHLSGQITSYTANQPLSAKFILGLLSLIVVSLWYLLQWPILIIDLIKRARSYF